MSITNVNSVYKLENLFIIGSSRKATKLCILIDLLHLIPSYSTPRTIGTVHLLSILQENYFVLCFFNPLSSCHWNYNISNSNINTLVFPTAIHQCFKGFFVMLNKIKLKRHITSQGYLRYM